MQDSETRFVNIKRELELQRDVNRNLEKTKPDSNKTKTIDNLDEFEFVDSKKDPKQFDFGVEVASVSNYASGGEGSSLNFGGGINTTWRLSKILSFTTGMLMSRQSIKYNQNENDGTVKSNLDVLYAANVPQRVEANKTDLKYEFIGIDIPLNLQFKFKRIVLTTGLSSLLYVQEKYSHTVNSATNVANSNTVSNLYSYEVAVNQVNEQEKSQLFDKFDFARLVNIAIGYRMPLNKGAIMLEPYLKLPFINMNSSDLKMGSGGLALRYYF